MACCLREGSWEAAGSWVQNSPLLPPSRWMRRGGTSEHTRVGKEASKSRASPARLLSGASRRKPPRSVQAVRSAEIRGSGQSVSSSQQRSGVSSKVARPERETNEAGSAARTRRQQHRRGQEDRDRTWRDLGMYSSRVQGRERDVVGGERIGWSKGGDAQIFLRLDLEPPPRTPPVAVGGLWSTLPPLSIPEQPQQHRSTATATATPAALAPPTRPRLPPPPARSRFYRPT